MAVPALRCLAHLVKNAHPGWGRLGHLDNESAAALLGRVDRRRLQHVVAAHLSQSNNRPDLARTALAAALECTPGWVAVADQELGTDWYNVA